jgi:hypothetical protein
MWRRSERRTTVDCRHVEAALTAYLKDGLSPARRQAVEDHLAACDTCARSVQQAQILESELRLQAARHDPILSTEAAARIHERVYKRMRRGLILQRTFKLAGVAVAVVVIALLAVGAMAYWQGRPPDVAGEQDVTPESGEGTPTLVPPSSTPSPPTTTPVPPTATAVPPTVTAVPPTATAVPPTATEATTSELSGCEGVLGRCIEIVYEDDSCTQVGPETLQAGMMTLVLTNRDDNDESAIYLRLLEDGKTWSDVEEWFGPLPSTKPMPVWVRTLGGQGGLDPHESVKRRVELTAGTYFSICSAHGIAGSIRPTADNWLGGKLTVED